MSTPSLVVGAAIVRHGRVLATRRAYPAHARGRWELPGGKVEAGEEPAEALLREVHEELSCRIRVTGHLPGERPIGGGLALRILLAEVVEGEPSPYEHDALRWLAPEELEDVDWLEPDRPFLPALREVLLDGTRLEGGNVGGAVRIGHTVRRPTGEWTPAVHRLLGHLRGTGLASVPQVLGLDERGREILSYLPGHVVDVDTELLSDVQLAQVAAWTRDLHRAVAGFEAPGPWRFFPVERPTLVGHNDLAPYNLCFEGDRLVGVFDWDLSGPSTPILELAHLAWNGIPLFRPLAAADCARRLQVLADAYGGPTAREVLAAVPVRTRLSIDGIRAALDHGDASLRGLTLAGEPERTEHALTGLLGRMPEIEEALG